MRYKNLADMFFQKRNELPEKAGYMLKQGGEWLSISFKDAVDRAERVAAGLSDLGVKKGDRIAVVSTNRIEWALTDYATQSLGAALVPIYPSLLPDQIKYILNDSESIVVVAADQIQFKKIEEMRGDLTFTKHFYFFDADGIEKNDAWKSYDELESEGKKALDKDPDLILKSIERVQLSDWATIIYTSGTTGEPKGAILTHNNLLSNVFQSTNVLNVFPEDLFLSFLPLSHIFERMAGHYLSCYHGATVAYAESIDAVAENLKEISPTLMVSVPRLYEKIYGRIIETVESGSPLKRKIFYWAIGVGKKHVHKTMNNEPISFALNKKYGLAHKLVFHKLQQALGGKNRFMISGGAPLSPEIAEFFGGVGIKILEGYGLTETSPVIAVNLLEKFRFGTVGPIIPGIEVKIAEDGEILTRGPHVMAGYYNNEAETKEVIDEQGWFYTGDIGIMEGDFLKITDRKKNIIVTSGGKNIAPQPIENTLTNSFYIEQAVVIGDKRKFCTAVIVAAEEAVGKWANEHGVEYKDYAELISHEKVQELIRGEIIRLTAKLASYEGIKNFVLSPALFTIESGELTPSLKIKRRVVEEKFFTEIEKMYDV